MTDSCPPPPQTGRVTPLPTGLRDQPPGRAMSDEPLWLKSPVDDLVHAWPPGQPAGEIWTALCPATCASAYLVYVKKGTQCLPCLLKHGAVVADRQDATLAERRRYQQANPDPTAPLTN